MFLPGASSNLLASIARREESRMTEPDGHPAKAVRDPESYRDSLGERATPIPAVLFTQCMVFLL